MTEINNVKITIEINLYSLTDKQVKELYKVLCVDTKQKQTKSIGNEVVRPIPIDNDKFFTDILHLPSRPLHWSKISHKKQTELFSEHEIEIKG